MQQEQRKWEVEQVPCSSDLLQFVQTTAQSEVTPTVPFLLSKKKHLHTRTECKLCQQGLRAENGIIMGHEAILTQTLFRA